MEPYVITISRQFASMGRSIAQELAHELDIEFYDRDIVEQVAHRLGLPISEVSDKEEASKSIYYKRQFPFGSQLPSIRDEIFMVGKNIIQDLAKKDSCIIVGRNADSILANHERHLNVYIYAPYAQRLKNCIEFLDMDEATAKKMIHEVDLARSLYRKRYSPEAQDEYTNRDIMIDSSKFGIQGTASLLSHIVRDRFY